VHGTLTERGFADTALGRFVQSYGAGKLGRVNTKQRPECFHD
jgi:hypothetical protein